MGDVRLHLHVLQLVGYAVSLSTLTIIYIVNIMLNKYLISCRMTVSNA